MQIHNKQIQFLEELTPGTMLITKRSLKTNQTQIGFMNDDDPGLEEIIYSQSLPKMAINLEEPLLFLKTKKSEYYIQDNIHYKIYQIYFLYGKNIVYINYYNSKIEDTLLETFELYND